MGERFLRLLDKWNMDITFDTAERSEVNHRILEQIQLIMDLNQGGVKGKYGLWVIRTKLGYKIDCSEIRYGAMQHWILP